MASNSNKKKILLMGAGNSGKTSMRSIIFANFIARETRKLEPTIDVEASQIRLLGNLSLSLWDCGGQKEFMDQYFTNQKEHIFSNVEALIYVLDVSAPLQFKEDVKAYQLCLDSVMNLSKGAKVFVLIHKIDLLPAENATKTLKQRELEIKQASLPHTPHCFGTSIWNETLYQAWSDIVSSFVPNVKVLEKHLQSFCAVSEADEAILFERSTFLVVAHYAKFKMADEHRFEKLSNIIKQFKLTCSKNTTGFRSMEIRNSRFKAFIDMLTPSTFIMLITHDLTIPSSVTQVNLNFARTHFERLLEA